MSDAPLIKLSLIGIFLNNFCSKHSNPYPDLISVFSLSVRVSTRTKGQLIKGGLKGDPPAYRHPPYQGGQGGSNLKSIFNLIITSYLQSNH
ncbi:MAG: hypothetical protein EWV80_07275 [Microcystis aeruginosa Ma_QC_B_20070730_S2]|uniref:Uncharacterized protein n=1 Tax=Microcystis aeruginosa Ma_QC_B_20070730_S2 TaxID=2486256 RepID=A0A552DY31_MICAE|nr:MAG: hypothetical protein EWV80_07275 [Microcystis aeruginosa Ma_QC_B_20070730_S2]